MTAPDGPLVADHQWQSRWVTAAEMIDRLGGSAARYRRIPGTVVPGLRDHHVHLGLVAHAELADASLSAVDDLGWALDEALAWRGQRIGGCRIRVAGPFLTAVGGYPSGRSWVPPAAVRQVRGVEDGRRTVAELARAGVDLIKIALHADMPVLDDASLAVIATAAAAYELPVVVHAEGPGQVARAAALAPYALAHTPWTEVLPDSLIATVAGRTAWISTLAIHEGTAGAAVAADNLRRFVAAGGVVRYGTDLGNGPAPVGLNPAEIAALVTAGLGTAAVLDSLCRAGEDADVVTWTPYPPVMEPAELLDWLSSLRRRTTADLDIDRNGTR